MSLIINKLTSGYGLAPVLKELTFEVNAGEIVGLIGLNGAGKSTTIKNIIGLLPKMSGTIEIDGLSLKTDGDNYRKKIGYIPETPVLYEELTLREHLNVTAMAYGIDKEDVFVRAQPLLEMFRLEEHLDWLPSRFSKGMKQKVMVICACLIQPDVYIIDEPFLGLDPLAIHDFLELLHQEKERGAAILMSTHILSTAEKHCDRLVVLHEGELRASGTMTDLRTEFSLPTGSLDDIYIRLTQEAGDRV